MKQLAIFLSFFLILQSAFSQTNNFAPVGAKWWYSSNDFPPTVTPLIIESIGDTIIEGKVCRMLSLNPTPNNVNGDRKIYIYNEGQRVYQYFPTEEAFYLLYDFSLSVGDEYWFYALDFSENLDSCNVEIIAIEVISINGVDLQKQYINSVGIPGCHFDWSDENIELFGNTKSIIPTYGLLEYWQGPLRCYEDPDFGFYSTGETATCDEILSDVKNFEAPEISFYPNPATDELFINLQSSNETDAYTIRIFNVTGTKLYFAPLASNSLHTMDIANLPSGLLYIQILKNNDPAYMVKIVHL